MVTGASTSSIHFDWCKKGVVNKPTVTFINNLLRVKEIVVAINKMDLVDYSEVYNKIKADFD
jgi:sulfate adenylyltransferase subunit 1